MPLMPVMLNGKIRLVAMPGGAGAKELYDTEEENARRYAVLRARQYVAGEQYDDENLETMSSLNLDPLTQRLPEHLRLHAYSTQLGEAVQFIANQLAERFQVECEDPAAQEIVDGALRLSDQLSGTDDDEDVTIIDVLEDALIAGDVAVYVRWDPIERLPFFEFWESEQIQVDFGDRSTIRRVVREEIIWVPDEIGGDKQVVEKLVYDLALRMDEDGERAWEECRVSTYWDDEEDPRFVEWLGLPVIPWGLLRVKPEGLRGTRGASVCSAQAMAAADRYNANEQVAWLIARYNSHANVAVVGDAAHLQLKQDERVNKDVADVITFPGGTNVVSLTLPTDPTMIEHQRTVLAESIYQTFGLTRVDPDTISVLGAVSGYALEILNRKSEGTMSRIRKNWIRDMKNLFVLALEVHQAMEYGLTESEDLAVLNAAPRWAGEDVDLFPNRKMTITLGTGYIVDDVMIRDDFLAKLISRDEALRRRGSSPDEIERISQELQEEAPQTEAQFLPETAAGGTVGVATP